MPGLRAPIAHALRSGLPVAVLLALTVGLAVAIGANLSNATPSKEQPFGWPGAANFEGGVATVRTQLVLAATLPALLLGLRLYPAGPTSDRGQSFLGAALAGFVLVPGAILAATCIGAVVAAASPPSAYLAFWVAHSLLALSCMALGLLARAATARHAPLAGLAAWSLFAVLLDDFVRWRLFRSEGYENLAAGNLPGWFYVLQVLSPIATYRALLIVWQPGFRDWLEHAALDDAALPGWLTPATLAAVLALLWVALPLGLAYLIVRLRSRHGDPNPVDSGTAAAGTAADRDLLPREAMTLRPLRGTERLPGSEGVRRPRLSTARRTELRRASTQAPR